MTTPYCLPILATSEADLTATIEQVGNEYPYAEVWLDYLKGFDDSLPAQLILSTKSKLIFLFRRLKLEKIQMPLERRLTLLQAIGTEDALIDLDLSQKQELIHCKRANLGTKLICSYHHYEHTPPLASLLSLVEQMETYSPAIYKFSTYCQSERDALVLLDLLLTLREQGKRFIVLGMGAAGSSTRIFGTLWGNALVFAPRTQEQASAPGQLTREEMDKIMSLLL